MSQQMPLILDNLTKNYGRSRGIEAVSLQLQPGEVFGFLGPNGAGKSTAIRTIMNFLHPSAGQATVMGLDSVKDDAAIKAKVGYLAGDYQMYDNLTGQQYLKFIANLRNAEGTAEMQILADTLQADLSKKIGSLSRGNMQKVALIAALLHDPELLILDEPTTGLDPLMQNKFYEIIRARAKRGKTVFMSSHILSEVQTICDRVAFMKDGKLEHVIDINKLRKINKKEVSLSIAPGTKLMRLPEFRQLQILHQSKTKLRFTTSEKPKELLKWLSIQPVADVTIQDVSIEDVFLKLYGDSGAINNV